MPTLGDLGERLAALLMLVVVALLAGLTLGHNTDRLQELPGLLLMVPAAIALRGNIFGALGSRLGTAIHAGTFRLSMRSSSVVGENVLASLVLTLATSVALAVLAKGAAVVFGVAGSIALANFIVISLVGGLLASVAVLVTALGLTSGSVRFGWDPDNVTAPLVTAVGDVATVPALVLASTLVGKQWPVLAVTAIAVAAIPVAVFAVLHAGRSGLKTILRESMPVLMIGILLDLVAGVTVERQLDSFTLFPALLVMLPAFLAVAGALGGTLSSRLASQLHLGTIAPNRVPEARARADIVASVGLAFPVFATCGVVTHAFSRASDLQSPGVGWLVAAALLAGIVATVMASAVAYYSTIASVRIGLDPDTYGIPLVTSTMDLLGAFALILAIEVLAFT
ncbi:MAG: magnesium transporter [Acidimicrobiales bacterium]|nr:magnesium transporter [Acidimicrobiales bacterium]